MLYAVYTRNQADNAEEAEAEALDAAGATSYLGFHVQRVEQMMQGEQARKRVMTAASEHRRAEESWRRSVGVSSAAETRASLKVRRRRGSCMRKSGMSPSAATSEPATSVHR